jgi:hypothetical protein
LENCRTQVTAYFDQNEMQKRLGRRPFGFVPLFPAIAGQEAMEHVEEYIRVFGDHVDFLSIVQAARRVKEDDSIELVNGDSPPAKRQKVDPTPKRLRSRQDVETKAITAGAAPSA